MEVSPYNSLAVPPSLRSILEKDAELHGAVQLSTAAFAKWLPLSGTPFFREYTDHGIPHIESVLSRSCALISIESWKLLTASDAATLTLACLLHDVGMHLSEEGFLTDSRRVARTIAGLWR